MTNPCSLKLRCCGFLALLCTTSILSYECFMQKLKLYFRANSILSIIFYSAKNEINQPFSSLFFKRKSIYIDIIKKKIYLHFFIIQNPTFYHLLLDLPLRFQISTFQLQTQSITPFQLHDLSLHFLPIALKLCHYSSFTCKCRKDSLSNLKILI